MRLVDTSVLLAYFNVTDVHHARARADVAAQDAISVIPEILVETWGTAKGRLGRAAADQMVESLAANPKVRWGPSSDVPAALAAARKAGISLVDGALVVAAQRSGLSLLTYDDAQRRAAGLLAD